VRFGYLAFRSGFIPRVVPVLLMVAGACILLESATFLVIPALHPVVSDVPTLPSAASEFAAILWLRSRARAATRAPVVGPGRESGTS
jgi:hypothetical protein